MKTVAIAQARMGSTRFPGKVLKPLDTRPVLDWVVVALRAAPGVDEVIIATSTLPADDEIVKWCQHNGVKFYRGSETDVLDRFVGAARGRQADVILRITADCPFLDPNVIGQVIQLRAMTGAAYCSNQPYWPDGLDVECFTREALGAAWNEAVRPTDRDTVTQYIIRNQDRFPAEYLTCPFPGAFKERWVLDTERDYELCKAIAERWGKITPPSCTDIWRILDAEPELRKINEGAIRNERFYEGLSQDILPRREFPRSNALSDRAERRIPGGSQTYSKSKAFFPGNAAPLFVSHGDGGRVFDIDGHDYVDLVGALLPVILGYRDPDVDEAVRRQMTRGMSFSLATKLEIELAEKLCEIIPCAEMVRFGKSGTDVTSAAVRLARAYTGRDHVLVGGYHGWADWSIGDTYGAGVPHEYRRLAHRIKDNNDLTLAINAYPNQIAAFILEPDRFSVEQLQEFRRICTLHGIVLIFDEVIAGFRYEKLSYQETVQVTPDLACFGKAMGNGMPISALAGQREFMSHIGPPNGIFMSGTFFGDTLSIAAALATIDKLERCEVAERLHLSGLYLYDKIVGWPAGGMRLDGSPCLFRWIFSDYNELTANDIQSLFIQEMVQNGVLIINANGFCYAHKKPEIDQIINAYNKTFKVINHVLDHPHELKYFLYSTITGTAVRKSA